MKLRIGCGDVGALVMVAGVMVMVVVVDGDGGSGGW